MGNNNAMKKSTLTLMQNAYRRTSLSLLLAGLLFVTQSAMAGDNDRGVAQETLMKIEIIVE